MRHNKTETQVRREKGIDKHEHEVTREPEQFDVELTDEAGDGSTALRGLIDTDSIRTILENEWVNAVVCRGDYTRGSGGQARSPNQILRHGPMSPFAALNELNANEPKTMWVDQKTDGRQIVTLYWAHTVYDISIDLRQAIYSFDAEAEDFSRGQVEAMNDPAQEIDISADDLEGEF